MENGFCFQFLLRKIIYFYITSLVAFLPQTLIGAKKEDSFHVVMHERSYPHLLKLFDAYKDLTGKQIEDLVENSKFGLDLKESYIALLTLLKTPAVYFATMLRNAISGAGTDDDVLIQVMVLRSEVKCSFLAYF